MRGLRFFLAACCRAGNGQISIVRVWGVTELGSFSHYDGLIVFFWEFKRSDTAYFLK